MEPEETGESQGMAPVRSMIPGALMVKELFTVGGKKGIKLKKENSGC